MILVNREFAEASQVYRDRLIRDLLTKIEDQGAVVVTEIDELLIRREQPRKRGITMEPETSINEGDLALRGGCDSQR